MDKKFKLLKYIINHRRKQASASSKFSFWRESEKSNLMQITINIQRVAGKNLNNVKPIIITENYNFSY